MHVEPYQKALTREQIPNPAEEGILKKRMLSIMLCTKWYCAGTFVDHEWVSEGTISQHVDEMLGMEQDYDFDFPCVVQRCMLWFSAPTTLNRTLTTQGLKVAKYHDASNMAIAYAISRPFGGEHSPRSCMLTAVAGVLYKKNRSWDTNKATGGWEMGGRPEF